MKPEKTGSPVWQKLTHRFNPDLHEVLMHQYFAAQFIGLAGHYLIPHRDDDSNTSMTYHPSRQQIVGEGLQDGKRLALYLPDLSIRLIENGTRALPEIFLAGMGKDQAFKKFTLLLSGHGFGIEQFSGSPHYTLPDHPLLHGALFNPGLPGYINETISYRYNAGLVIQEILSNYKSTDPVRIWPHHFDSGGLIPATHDESGQITGSVGIGWAIPDVWIDELYYYVSIWTKDHLTINRNMPDLGAGSWVTSNWNGAILRLSEIIQASSPGDQYDLVRTFLNRGTDFSLKIIHRNE